MASKKIDFVAILYLVVWVISPFMQISFIYRAAALACTAVLFMLNRFRINKKLHTVPVFFVLLVMMSAVIEKGSLSAAIGQIAIILLLICYLMNYWYESDWSVFELLIPITLLLFTYWNYRSIVILHTDPNAARAVVRNDELAMYYLRLGVGGYGFTYSQVCIMPAIVGWILSSFKNRKIFFAIGVLWAVSYIEYLSLAGYTIAVIASFIGALILFIYRKEKTLPALIISLILVIVFVYFIGYNEQFRQKLLEIFADTKVAAKINDITTTIETDETADSIYQRIIRYRASLMTMLQYPVIGSWWAGGTRGHSALLDAFAQYGLFGGYIYLKMLYYVPISWKKRRISRKTTRALNATIVTVTFVALFDSIPYNIVIMPTVILPILLSSIEKNSLKTDQPQKNDL